MGENPLITFIELLAVVLVFFVGAMILTFFINLMPANPMSNITKLIYIDVFGTFDKSFFFLLIFLLMVDVFKCYQHPSIGKGIANFIFILAFGFIFVNTTGVMVGAFSLLPFNAIFPTTYSILNNNYLGLLLFFFLIMATALCFRRKSESEQESANKESGFSDGS